MVRTIDRVDDVILTDGVDREVESLKFDQQ